MPNQMTSSPFSSDIKTTGAMPTSPESSNDGFLIRTMKEDLALLQNKGLIEEEKNSKVNPTPEILPIKPKPLNEKEITSQKISSFVEHEKPAAEIVEVAALKNKNTNENNNSGAVKIIITIIIILIITIIGLGTYYFFLTKKANSVAIQPDPIQVATPIETEKEEVPISVEIETPTPKYSSEKPNYLTLDPATQSADEIKNSILKVSEELRSEQGNYPYEFIIVDNNNNPITFPIFAAAIKLTLSQAILNNLGTNFSLYIYKDGANMRLALSAEIKTKDQLMKELIKQEKTFPLDASFLFLNSIPEIKTGNFATSPYNNYSIRFLNLNVVKDLSIDYTTTDTELIIATSKNTSRAILDKIDSTKTVSQNETKEETLSSEIIPSKEIPQADVNNQAKTGANSIQ